MQIRLNGKIGYADEEFDEDIYNTEEVEILLEDDEISAEEEAFMRGYLDDRD